MQNRGRVFVRNKANIIFENDFFDFTDEIE